jgi:hypothetical protein
MRPTWSLAHIGLRLVLVGALAVAVRTAAAADGTAGVIPDLSGFWQHGPLEELEPLPFEPAPVRHVNGPLDRGNVHVLFMGDRSNPNLKPWAAEIVGKIAESTRTTDAAGRPVITNNPQESCRPSGVPNVIILPAPMKILQEPGQVTFLYQRDHQTRRAYFQRQHTPNLKPTPYGESIARYDGDTLVIDTIGMMGNTPMDMFGTPHTDALHVIERYRLINNAMQLEVGLFIEDPNTFYRPFNTRMTYNRSNAEELVEEICAENNRLPTSGPYAIPIARDSDPRF